jgi:acyl-CoA reductase-like NAD-dependent aldehyde dehydrogenase
MVAWGRIRSRRLGNGGYDGEPTVFRTYEDRAQVVREEIFGAVLVLASGVWTRDISNAHRIAGWCALGLVEWACGGPA